MLKKLECFVLACDGCGEEPEHGDGYVPHYPAELKGEAEAQVQDCDWTVWNGRHWCLDCRPACSTCGHLFGEHDYGEAPCMEEDSCTCQAFTVEEQTR